ncbi:tail fiber domain-containing protein, partial [Burkholderia sp. SIMBA_042]|uniref:tail fiber domain-containing protein n=1 Tax=Burkholderia sp. SIMBA_042 TaxID=3085783 RepID=UPI00397DACB7
MALRPVQYEKKNSIESNEYNRHEIGFVAQEVAKVIPSIVTKGVDADKTLAVSYTEIIPILTKAIQ